MKRKLSTETPVCPQECLVIISYIIGLSFALERIGPLAAITIIVFYLLILYLLALPNTPENPFASIYNESLIKTACQHLLFLVGFDTLIYQKYYDTPPILVGHQGQSGLMHGRCTRGRRRLTWRPRWTPGRRRLTRSLWDGGGLGGRCSPGEGGLGFLGVSVLGAEPRNMMYFFCHKTILRLTSPSLTSPSGVAKSSSRSSIPGTMSSTETRA
jgi:hypothetical protein